MNKLTINNLQLFCRICLSELRPDLETLYNIYIVPNLTKLLTISTSLPINDDAYPKNLCQLCYDKVEDFQLFRSKAQQSAEVLNNIISGQDNFECSGSDPDPTEENSLETNQNSIEKDLGKSNNGNLNIILQEEKENLNEQADDQLLLPELAVGSVFEKPIKTEANTIEEPQINNTSDVYHINQVEVQSTSNDCDDMRNAPINFEMFEELRQNFTDNNDIELICEQCYKKYSSKNALKKHLKRHANIKKHICEICGVAKITRAELRTHMRTHEPNVEKFKCNLCPQEFRHKNAIQRHVRAVHEGLRPYPCDYCTLHFKTQNSKICHERLHTGEKPFSCEICNKSFAQSEALKSHMKSHDKSLRTHVCKCCSQRFITRKNLIDHEERHRSDKPHICAICNQGFSKKEDLRKHRKTHQDSENLELNNVRSPLHVCKHCSRRFISRIKLIDHEKLHSSDKRHICETCNRVFNRSSNLIRHQNTHQNSENSELNNLHVCKYCSRKFISRIKLIDHEKLHRSDKPHKCETCNRVFNRRDHLLRHQKIHQGSDRRLRERTTRDV